MYAQHRDKGAKLQAGDNGTGISHHQIEGLHVLVFLLCKVLWDMVAQKKCAEHANHLLGDEC